MEFNIFDSIAGGWNVLANSFAAGWEIHKKVYKGLAKYAFVAPVAAATTAAVGAKAVVEKGITNLTAYFASLQGAVGSTDVQVSSVFSSIGPFFDTYPLAAWVMRCLNVEALCTAFFGYASVIIISLIVVKMVAYIFKFFLAGMGFK